MTEQNPEQLPEQHDVPADDAPLPEPAEDTDDEGRPIHPAPEDAADAEATGYAVYDRTLGQYVPGVEAKKPTSSQATKRVPEGHTAAIVRV
jgi:hypothetical protein